MPETPDPTDSLGPNICGATHVLQLWHQCVIRITFPRQDIAFPVTSPVEVGNSPTRPRATLFAWSSAHSTIGPALRGPS